MLGWYILMLTFSRPSLINTLKCTYTYYFLVKMTFYSLQDLISEYTPQWLERPRNTLLLKKHSVFVHVSPLTPCTSLAMKLVVFLEAWIGPIKDNLLGPLIPLNNNFLRDEWINNKKLSWLSTFGFIYILVLAEE